jgi:hypothetical protein
MWLIQQFEPFLKLGICKEYISMAKAKTARSVNSEPRLKQSPVAQFKAVEESRSRIDSPVDFEAEIRHRAYELYQERGCVSGHEREDWLIAEREVMSRYNLQAV